ncbi:uncharacterized protein B0I36DRAFT_316334 [Microdochium trichocladiopsis]|uniref:Uncharacterized protein n=1 Tax=Microdochium trichocladiopsis TaxID=1682393 RepID=A0A9P8YCW7_9PEZI|nr:uncharacterized protein B0I36DRAFT_316334 [Microdochium trichocladiopsis]KAH7038461.1 hypothetical protein B0I36DRAFT_316334 [Microdochium trichocladiopsis]
MEVPLVLDDGSIPSPRWRRESASSLARTGGVNREATGLVPGFVATAGGSQLEMRRLLSAVLTDGLVECWLSRGGSEDSEEWRCCVYERCRAHLSLKQEAGYFPVLAWRTAVRAVDLVSLYAMSCSLAGGKGDGVTLREQPWNYQSGAYTTVVRMDMYRVLGDQQRRRIRGWQTTYRHGKCFSDLLVYEVEVLASPCGPRHGSTSVSVSRDGHCDWVVQWMAFLGGVQRKVSHHVWCPGGKGTLVL